MPQAEAEKCHPAGLNFRSFPNPYKKGIFAVIAVHQKRGISGLFGHRKKGVFVRDCATIVDTFSEREKLNFLQRKKGVKSELKEPDKKGGTVPVVYVETGRFAGVYSRGGVGGCPVGLEGVQGKRGANTGTVGGVGGS